MKTEENKNQRKENVLMLIGSVLVLVLCGILFFADQSNNLIKVIFFVTMGLSGFAFILAPMAIVALVKGKSKN